MKYYFDVDVVDKYGVTVLSTSEQMICANCGHDDYSLLSKVEEYDEEGEVNKLLLILKCRKCGNVEGCPDKIYVSQDDYLSVVERRLRELD